MNRANRVLLGASIGALISLLLHPLSRPYLIGLLNGPGVRTIRNVQDGVPNPPTNLREAAQFTQGAFEAMANDHALVPKELSSLLTVVGESIRHDPTNAYWRQVQAAVEFRVGHEDAAEASWIAGSACSTWNDYQSEVLREESGRLARSSRAEQGWQFAYLYRCRSTAAAEQIEKFARRVVATTDMDSHRSLQLRYATIANGALLRDGSRNVEIGEIGSFIVEVGAYPPDLAIANSPHRLLLGENRLFNRLTQVGEVDWASYVQQQFEKNDAWQALSTQDIAEEQARYLGLLALLLAVLPGAVMIVGAIGTLVWGFGILCEKAFPDKGFGWAFPILAALILSNLVYWLTSFVTAAIAAALCGLFLYVTPSQQRKTKGVGFGPTFGFTIGALAVAAGSSLVVYQVWGSGPAEALLPYLSVPSEYFGQSPLFIGLAILFFAMVFLASPFWSLAQRFPTPRVFSQGLKQFGLTLAIPCLALTVFGTPVVIYADQKTGQTLRALMLNEPVYYHLKYGPAS